MYINHRFVFILGIYSLTIFVSCSQKPRISTYPDKDNISGSLFIIPHYTMLPFSPQFFALVFYWILSALLCCFGCFCCCCSSLLISSALNFPSKVLLVACVRAVCISCCSYPWKRIPLPSVVCALFLFICLKLTFRTQPGFSSTINFSLLWEFV